MGPFTKCRGCSHIELSPVMDSGKCAAWVQGATTAGSSQCLKFAVKAGHCSYCGWPHSNLYRYTNTEGQYCEICAEKMCPGMNAEVE